MLVNNALLVAAALRCPAGRLRMTEAPANVNEGPAAVAIRNYFGAWNRRDMDAACDCFAEGCVYDDTQYNGAFSGKAALKQHLIRVADALPPTFQFCIDDIADGGSSVGVQWHVENDGRQLPFTRGCSMYKADQDGLLVSGFDVPEPAPLKPGSASLLLLGVASKLIAEPVRAVPLVTWGLYVSIVFFSNGILPGPDATQLDAATWTEVFRLPLNFGSEILPNPNSRPQPQPRPYLRPHPRAGRRPLPQLLVRCAHPSPALLACPPSGTRGDLQPAARMGSRVRRLPL
jgi:ketosteroid isomerase-like protein